ncbi:MAG TPA: GNAT family N-acyltransferase [Verrucomicrobiae bacterium]|jgi:putative hemolysin|nr:GNAT family N-acyltransferase [Verrucomicrobiae bacterium]
MTNVSDRHNDGNSLGQLSAPGGPTPPMAEVSRANYRLRLATSERDVRAAQLLRFVVFNLELREGLEQSYATCLDADAYDAICDHLLVEEVSTGEVIGTYRLQTGRRALENRGYYSAQEFDFTPYEPLREQMVELGRACVHSGHRNLTVLSLLWKGIASYVTARSCRYLVGCSSLTSQDAAVGLAAYAQLQRYVVREEWRTNPLPKFICESDARTVPSPKIPKLLTAYLTLGAKICGPPALDREFKTIDFLTFLDLQSLTARTIARYMS